MRCLILIPALVSSLTACSQQPSPPADVAQGTAPSAALPSAGQDNKGVIVATRPSNAKVLLKGEEIGQTPLKLLVTEDMNLILESEGFVRQAVWVTKESKPNLIVDLIPAPGQICCPCSPPEIEGDNELALAAQDRAQPRTKGANTAASKTNPTKVAPASAGTASATAPTSDPVLTAPVIPTAPVVQQPTAPVFNDMKSLKEALRLGKIDKATYNRIQAEIRQKREVEFESAKKAYRENKINKETYAQKIRQIKLKYEG